MSAAQGLLSLTYSAFMIVSVCVYSTGCTTLCQWVFTVQGVQGCVSVCLQYRLYNPVSMGVYRTGCTSLCLWVFTEQAAQACVSVSLQNRLYKPVSVCVYRTGCTRLCQWVFTEQAVQACVNGCLQNRLYKAVRPYFGVFAVRDFPFQQFFPVVLSDSKYSYFKIMHPRCVGL
jgi:hypothetical protein